MKILCIFGSKSDESIYGPLVSLLDKSNEVQFEILSAHRNPVELENLLSSNSFDLIVAGAGLAAHLPGVIASKVKTPVLGIPVNSVMQGLDALLSIQQMPFGVPVLSSGVDQIKSISNFINEYHAKLNLSKINLVLNADPDHPDYKKEIDRTLKLCKEKDQYIVISKQYQENQFNIVLVTQKDEILNDQYAIHVPLLTSDEKKNPRTALSLLEWTTSGGMWVGTNNTRNAILFFNKLYQ